jgi:hypothetical protein
MERITNVRISTLTKVVPLEADITVTSVAMSGTKMVVVDADDNAYELGTITVSNACVVQTVESQPSCGGDTSRANVIANLLRAVDGKDGKDGITPDMSGYYDKTEIDRRLLSKQDTIKDLATIRSGAEKGATALQRSDIDKELTFSNNPVRNTAVLMALTEIDGKKQDVISDLTRIRDGAEKGATAVQSVKTINGESIVGEGNITIEGGSGGNGGYVSNIEDKTLAMPSAVGGIAKDTTIESLEGKTYNEMFDDLLFPTVNPSFTAPSATIKFKNYSSTQEVGATGPTSSNFTVSYSAGAIILNGNTQATRGGTQNTTNSFIFVNNSASNKTLPTKVTLGSTTFKYRAAYNEGPQPKNNKGGDYDSPLAAGTVDSSAITLNGTYPWYASTVGVTTSAPVAKQALVQWNATAGKMYTGDTGFTLEASGTVPQVIKVPNSRTITSMEMYDTGAEKWKSVSISQFDDSPTSETISVNGTNVTYTVYTYSGATRGQVRLRIKF